MRRAVPRTVSAFRDRPGWEAAAVFLFALLLRLHDLGGKPYWLDEVTTLRRSALAFLPLLRDSLTFHHLPLYFLIESAVEPLGLDPFTMRLPSAVFGAIACALLVPIGEAAWRRSAGVAAGLLTALSPFQLQYAQEARSYTLVLCFILCGVWGMLRLARAPETGRSGWLLYAVGTALALDTLSVALFWFAAAQACAALIAVAAVRPGGAAWFLRRWLPVQAIVLAAYLPFVLAMVWLTHGRMGSGLDWVPPPTLHSVWTIGQSVLLLRQSSLIAFRIFPAPLDLGGVPWPGLAVLALAVFGAIRQRRALTVRVLMLITLSLPVGIALCSLRSSLWMPRYLMWSAPLLFLLAGTGVASLPRRTRPVVLVLVSVLGLINLWPYYNIETKPLWNQAAAFLRAARHPGDLLFVDDPAAIDMMNVSLDPGAVIANQTPPDGFGPDEWTESIATALAAQKSGRRVWIVHGRVGQNDSTTLQTLLHGAAPLGEPAETQTVGRDITILRVDPTARQKSVLTISP